MNGARYVLLTTLGNPGAANVLAARLRAEGIAVRVHSPSFGPYPMTVGEMAETELWVLEDRIDEACTIAMDTEINDALEGDGSPTSMPYTARMAALGIAGVMAVMWILRLVRMWG